jgi:hydroxymethylpyrimidine/phosphomethylpyrimidine kinase
LEIEPKFVVKQIEACVSDIGCDAVKTGMLSSDAIIDAVASTILAYKLKPLVVDR